MKTSQKLFALPLAALALAGLLTGCAHGTNHTADEPTQTAPTAVATTSAAPTATASTPAAAAPTEPTAGATVAAAQVAAVRAAGGHVYVSPNGSGDGVVVDPAAPLPAAAVADAHTASPDTAWASDGKAFAAATVAQKALGTAYKDAGLSAFILMRYPTDIRGDTISGTVYTFGAVNVAVDHTKVAPHGATVAAAMAAAKGWFDAFPNVPIITFDAVQ